MSERVISRDVAKLERLREKKAESCRREIKMGRSALPRLHPIVAPCQKASVAKPVALFKMNVIPMNEF